MAHRAVIFAIAQLSCYYRAMDFSAKRGIEIACRPSVRLSVRDVGKSGAHRLEILKLIALTISPTPSLLVAQRPPMHLLPGEHGEIWGRLEVAWEKWRAQCWSTEAAKDLRYA